MELVKKTLTSLLLSFTFFILIQGQQNKILLTIDGKDITQDEFLWMYNKNEAATEKLSVEAYLDSYVEFQLKIRDAEKMGLDTTLAFREEMDEYKDQVYSPYLYQEPSLDMLVKEAYERMRYDVHASHILIRVAPGASPADTLLAFRKISDLRERIINGEDFSKVAMENSEDPAARVNGGNLHYFTALNMVYPIETAAYETQAGSISKPIRSSNGYHIIKVNERRPAEGQVRVSHIFTATINSRGEQKTEKELEDARLKIYAAYESLNAGMPFPEVVEEFSEDPRAPQTKGELPVFGVGQMDPEFEKQVFKLGGLYSITKPFQTVFGWHIVRLLEKIPVQSFRSMQEDLQTRVLNDNRPEYHQMLHIERVKQKYGFSAYPEELELVFSEGDSSLLRGEWEAGDLISNQTTLLSIGNSKISIGDFAAFIQDSQSSDKRARHPRYYMTEMYYLFIDKSVLDYEYNAVAEIHPETKNLLREYHDGMLLYEISDLKVWSRALRDTAGLNSFFQKHRDQYMWGERYDAYILTSNDGANVDKVRKKYKKIQSGAYDAVKLNDKFCDNDTVACVYLAHVITEKGVYDRIDQMNGVIGPGPVYDSKVTLGFVILNKLIPPEPKQLSEVKGQVVSDYQTYLEKQWIKELKQTYPVTKH